MVERPAATAAVEVAEIAASVMQHVSRTSNLYPDTYMLTDTCCRIQVARSGYMLTVSRQHNYYSFRLVACPFVSSNRRATNWQQFCCRHKKHVDRDRTHVNDNSLPSNMLPWCKRGFSNIHGMPAHFHEAEFLKGLPEKTLKF